MMHLKQIRPRPQRFQRQLDHAALPMLRRWNLGENDDWKRHREEKLKVESRKLKWRRREDRKFKVLKNNL
jgi:hypothetical protein